MSTIDLRELAKSLMFAEKAKEEAEELRRDNELLYNTNTEYIEQYQKDRATISSLERKVQQLEEGTKNLTGALISKGGEFKELQQNYQEALNRVASLERLYKKETESIRECFAKHGIELYPSVDSLINAFENLDRLYESLPVLPDDSMSQAIEDMYHLLTIHAKIPSDVVRATNMLGKMEMLSEYIHKLQDEREYHQYRYEKIREIILPALMDNENETK